MKIFEASDDDLTSCAGELKLAHLGEKNGEYAVGLHECSKVGRLQSETQRTYD